MVAAFSPPTDGAQPNGPTTVGFVLVPGFALMSYACAIEPLRAANRLSGRELYRWWHAAPGNAPVAASNGVAILPDRRIGDDKAEADLVLVCAGGNPATFENKQLFAWLRRLARRGITIGGISGGPYILANAGLLEGRRCTLHWEHVPSFQETFPGIDLSQSLFEIEADRITCSGGIAAVDMWIALISRDHGPRLAAAVGDWFLHTHIREGFGPQRMDLRYRLDVTDENLLRILETMEGNLENPLPRQRLAALAGLSIRQLERAFRRQLGRGIHAHYLALRLERAEKLLRESALPAFDIALATGFSSGSQFSRAFKRAFGLSPSERRQIGRETLSNRASHPAPTA